MAQSDPDFVAFLKAYPTYPTTHIIDDLRVVEYSRLDIGGHIYLDYTGGGLYADSQLRLTTRYVVPGGPAGDEQQSDDGGQEDEREGQPPEHPGRAAQDCYWPAPRGSAVYTRVMKPWNCVM